MRYSLDLRIIGNQAYLDSIKGKVPAEDDPMVDSDLYNAPTISETEDGNLQLSGMIRFIEDAGRKEVKEAILDLTDMVENAGIGSRMALHTCYHDENPPKPCKETVIWKVGEEE